MVGAEKVAAILIGLFHRRPERSDLRIEIVDYNGMPALVARLGEHLEGVFLVEITDERITNFYAVRNPDKLLAVTVPRQISRRVRPQEGSHA